MYSYLLPPLKLNNMGLRQVIPTSQPLKGNAQTALWTERDFRYQSVYKLQASEAHNVPIVGDNGRQNNNDVVDCSCTTTPPVGCLCHYADKAATDDISHDNVIK